MSETPLRLFLATAEQSAEDFAAAHGFSAWSVRHWARGNKHPSLEAQQQLESATAGRITPADWLEFRIARSADRERSAAA